MIRLHEVVFEVKGRDILSGLPEQYKLINFTAKDTKRVPTCSGH